MKEKFTNTLGLFGTILYFLYSILVSIMPFIMIGASFWLTFLFLCIEQMFPLSTFVFWIWGLVRAIGGVQDVWAIIYYVLFVVLFIPFILGCILDSLPHIPSRTSSHAKQRYCKLCGGTIDPATKKCSKCGKQYLHLKLKRNTVLFLFLGLITFTLLVLNIYQFNLYTLAKVNISDLNSSISVMQSEQGDLEKELTAQSRTISTQKRKISDLERQVHKFDSVFYDLKYSNIGYASSNFKSNESIIIVGANDRDRKFTLTAHWSNGGNVYVSYSSPTTAYVSFDNDSWRTSTTMTVLPVSAGPTVVTFSNDVDSNTFKILIIVTE